MMTQKKTLTFNKENNNRWYVVCNEYEVKVTKEFRETFTYTDKDGEVKTLEISKDIYNELEKIDPLKQEKYLEYLEGFDDFDNTALLDMTSFTKYIYSRKNTYSLQS